LVEVHLQHGLEAAAKGNEALKPGWVGDDRKPGVGFMKRFPIEFTDKNKMVKYQLINVAFVVFVP
jgi:hypothetical protein